MLGSSKLLVLLVASSCLAKPPPGFAPERDKDSSKYKYEYSVLDGLGGHSGRVESREGPHTLGGYFVSVPMGHNAMGPTSLQQTVSFITDSWGYHPIVSYTTNHGSAVTTAQFALGGKAVAALRQQEQDQLQQQQQQAQPVAVVPAAVAVPASAEAVASGEPGELGVPATSLLAPAAPLPTPSATLLPPALVADGPSGPSGSPSPTSTPTPPGKVLSGLLPVLSDLPDVANDISGQRGVQVTSFLADTNAAAPGAQGTAREEEAALPNLKALKGADSISAYVISDADERGNGLSDASSASSTSLAPSPTTLKPIVVSEHGLRAVSTTPTPPSAYSFGSTVTVTPEAVSASSPSAPSAPSAPSSLGTTAAEGSDTASTPTVVITPRPLATNGQDAQQQVAAASNAFEVTDEGHQYLAPHASASDDEQHRDDEELQQQQLQQQHELKKGMSSHKSSAVYEAHYRTEVEVQKSVELPSDITLDAVKVADEDHVPQPAAVHAPSYYISQHQQILRHQQHLKDLEQQQQKQEEEEQQQQQQLDEQRQQQAEQQLEQDQHQQGLQLQQQQLNDHQHRARKLHHQQLQQDLEDQQLQQEVQDQRHIQQIQEQSPDLMRIPLQSHNLHLQQDQQLQLQAEQDQQLQLQAQQDHQLQVQAQQDQQLQAHQDQRLQLQAQQGHGEQLQEDPQDLDLQQSVTDTQPQHVQLLQPLTLHLPFQMLQQAHFLQHAVPNVMHDALLLPPPQQHHHDHSVLQPPPHELQEQPHLQQHLEAADVPLPEENKLQLEALVQQMAADVTRLVRIEDHPAPTKLVEVEKSPSAHNAPPPPPAANPDQVTRLVHLERPYSHPFMAMQYPPPHGMHPLLPFQHYIALPIKDLQLSESQQQSQHQHPQQLHHKYKISHAASEDELTATSHKAVPGIDPDKVVHCAEHVFSFRPSHSMYPAHWKGRSSRRGGPALQGHGQGHGQGRHRGNLRKLCIEYGGFKPPLVPSTPIKEDGKPVHPSNDD